MFDRRERRTTWKGRGDHIITEWLYKGEVVARKEVLPDGSEFCWESEVLTDLVRRVKVTASR
jgi:hypothetical protein